MVDERLPGPVIAVVGPTATGKTALGIELAKRYDGEVVNADAMQLYRGMDVGTAKPTEAERDGVPHHALDLWEVTEAASVVAYRDHARAVIDRLLAAGRTPVVVGGSGLYVRGALEAFDFPGTDPATRARMEADVATYGPAAMHARLAERDPAAAAAILPSNGRRIARALEVVELTGRPFSASMPRAIPVYDTITIGLDRDTDELDPLIDARTDRMFERGLVEEVRELERRGLRDGQTASRAVGYVQVLRMLAGERDEATAREETARATRRLVRKQRSWFGKEASVAWLDSGRADLLDAATELIRSAPERLSAP